MIYTPLTKKAIKIMSEAHKDQVDKSGILYVFHPWHIAESMTDEASTCVALLHDVVEDTDLTLEDLANEGFPDEIIEAIEYLTKPEEQDYFEYIAHVKENELAARVKYFDLAHNMDIARLDTMTREDAERLDKYERARQILIEDLVAEILEEKLWALSHDEDFVEDIKNKVKKVPDRESLINYLGACEHSGEYITTKDIIMYSKAVGVVDGWPEPLNDEISKKYEYRGYRFERLAWDRVALGINNETRYASAQIRMYDDETALIDFVFTHLNDMRDRAFLKNAMLEILERDAIAVGFKKMLVAVQYEYVPFYLLNGYTVISDEANEKEILDIIGPGFSYDGKMMKDLSEFVEIDRDDEEYVDYMLANARKELAYEDAREFDSIRDELETTLWLDQIVLGMLQFLPEFPLKGVDIIVCALDSISEKNRLSAVKVVGEWVAREEQPVDNLSTEIYEALKKAYEFEQETSIKSEMEKVMFGGVDAMVKEYASIIYDRW